MRNRLTRVSAGAEDGRGLVVVQDQVGVLGGTERVVSAVLDRYPAARVLALLFEQTDGYPPPAWLPRIQGVVGGRRRHHVMSPLYARRIAAAPVRSARVVFTVPGSGGWSVAAPVPAGARHVCYSPGIPRWLRGDSGSYFVAYPRVLRPWLYAALPLLRRHYGRLMKRPHRLLTNSRYSAGLIHRHHGRAADVVYPPVRTDFFTPEHRERVHVLCVARLVKHKRVHLLVEAFRGLDEQLVVVGGGPELERLRAAAPPNVRFVGVVSDDELLELYRASRLVVVPSVEEFGIVAAEAQACGVPVVAAREGAAPEVVIEGETGMLLDDMSAASVNAAVRSAASRAFDVARCRASAARFSEDLFVSAIERVLDEEFARTAARPTPAVVRTSPLPLAAASPRRP